VNEILVLFKVEKKGELIMFDFDMLDRTIRWEEVKYMSQHPEVTDNFVARKLIRLEKENKKLKAESEKLKS
jgi:hypothetical protein